MASAICAVIVSCVCRRLAKISTTRAILEMPTTASRRHVGDERLAEERRHVVLAMALDVDVLEHDHVVIALHVLEGARELFGRALDRSRRTIRGRRRPRAWAYRSGLRALGSSPAQAISVRTASIAASREGRFCAASAGERHFRISLIREFGPCLRGGGRAGRVSPTLGGAPGLNARPRFTLRQRGPTPRTHMEC